MIRLPNSFSFSLTVSLLFHGAVCAVICAQRGHTPPVLPGRPEREIVFTLVNTPDEAEARTVAVANEPPAPAPTPPGSPEPAPVPPKVEVVAKVDPPSEKPMAAVEPTPAVVSSPPPQSPRIPAVPVTQQIVRVVAPPSLPATTAPVAVEGRGPMVKATANYRRNPEPAYPLAARKRRLEGQVILTVIVDPRGHVEKVTVRKSSGHALLDQAASDAVRDWEFEPARIDQVPVTSEVEVPVRFTLSN